MKNLFIIVLTLISFTSFGQYDEVEESSGEFYTGGGLTLNFSNFSTNIGANPILGYRFTDKLSAGVGANFSYYKRANYSFTAYGPMLFGRYLITNSIYAQSEFHLTNVDNNISFAEPSTSSERVWTQAWFVGGGYRQAIGERTFANLTVLWDVIQDKNSPYVNPYISGGISFSL